MADTIIRSEREILNKAYIEESKSIATNIAQDSIDPQKPIKVDGDSVYEIDIDFNNSDFTNWIGDPAVLFQSPFSTSITNSTTDDPKVIIIAFNRTISALQIGFGENNGGDFSNIKVSLLGSAGSVRTLFDGSGDNTKRTSFNIQFDNQLFNSILIEFMTVDSVSLSNLTIQKARYNTVQILAKTPSNDFINLEATESGNLKTTDSENGLAISKGIVTGTSFIHKFGEAGNIDTADGFANIWDGSNDILSGKISSYTFSTIADIDSITSTNVLDTQTIEIQGLDSDYNLLVQTITLTGQTTVILPIPLIRVFRMKNIGTVNLIGETYLRTTGTSVTNGIPDVITSIRAIINDGNNQTLMAIFTIPAGKTGFMRDWYASLSKDKTTSCVIRLQARPFGQVFQLKHVSAISNTGTSYIQHNYNEPEKFNEKTDIIMSANTTTNDSGVGAGFDIVLVDN